MPVSGSHVSSVPIHTVLSMLIAVFEAAQDYIWGALAVTTHKEWPKLSRIHDGEQYSKYKKKNNAHI